MAAKVMIRRKLKEWIPGAAGWIQDAGVRSTFLIHHFSFNRIV
jgi:hypothetical protein